jgi:UDP-GlcNAc3NAcA epimerase
MPVRFRCMTVVGARPQIIKAAVLSRQFAIRDDMEELLVHTGQHYDDNMSAVFFQELEIPEPKHYLGIGSASHGAQTGRMLAAMEEVILLEKPDCVLVYGDTNSTLAGALAAAKLHIPVAHVEAGLRSFNRRMPEEINRVVTDHIADLLFTPTAAASALLHREGIHGRRIHQVGDVMYDAALFFGSKAERESRILETLGLPADSYVLCTVHRAENTDNMQRLAVIVAALNAIARELPIVLPLHPRTAGCLRRTGLTFDPTVQVIAPVGYLDMAQLQRNARLVVTDSGGVQKEAFFHGRSCVTLRNETEWTELVDMGWNSLAPPVPGSDIRGAVLASLGRRGIASNPFGDGTAGKRILEVLAVVHSAV